jgi:hypothetical protein
LVGFFHLGVRDIALCDLLVVLGDHILIFMLELLKLRSGSVLLGFMIFGFELNLLALAFDGLKPFGDLREFFLGG